MSAEEAYQQIVDSISYYLRLYGLWRRIKFIYKGDIQDIDILSPEYSYDLIDNESDIETVIKLLERLEIAIPKDVLTKKMDIQKKKEERQAIKHFEEWLVGYFAYLDIEPYTVEALLYSDQQGVMVKFYELDQLFGKPIIPAKKKKRPRIIRKK